MEEKKSSAKFGFIIFGILLILSFSVGYGISMNKYKVIPKQKYKYHNTCQDGTDFEYISYSKIPKEIVCNEKSMINNYDSKED